MSDVNRQWLLRSRPVGMVQESDFELKESPVPSPGDGQALVRNTHLAFEPAMRGAAGEGCGELCPCRVSTRVGSREC